MTTTRQADTRLTYPGRLKESVYIAGVSVTDFSKLAKCHLAAFAETVNDGLGTLKLSILAPLLLDPYFSSLFTRLRGEPTFRKGEL